MKEAFLAIVEAAPSAVHRNDCDDDPSTGEDDDDIDQFFNDNFPGNITCNSH